MADRTKIEVYDWPEGTERSTKVAIDLIEGDSSAPIPSVGDVILIPAPTEAVRDGDVDEDEYFIMQGMAKPYRVIGRELMYSPRPKGAQINAPLPFGNLWIFVRAMTKDEYWGTEP